LRIDFFLLFIFTLADLADLADSISPFISTALGIVAKILPCQGLAEKIAAHSPTQTKRGFYHNTDKNLFL